MDACVCAYVCVCLHNYVWSECDSEDERVACECVNAFVC